MKTKPAEALFRPAMVLMSGRVVGFIAAFAIPMVLARLFDQSTFGTYKQLFLIYTTLFGIAQVGMAESLYYFLPQDARHGGRYAFNVLMVLGGFGLALLVGLWLLQAPLASLLNNPDLVGYIPYVGVYLLFMLMAVQLEIVLTVRKQHFGASCVYAVSDLLRALLYIVPVLIFPRLEWLLWGAIAFAACRFLAALVYLSRAYRGDMRPDGERLRSHLGYALPFGVAGMVEIVQANFHLYAVSWYFDAATFAIYAVGCLQVPLVDFLMTSTSNVMMVTMREKARENRLQDVLDIWLDATRKLALVLCPMVAGMLVLAHETIVLLFTADYADSVPVFMIWTLTMSLTVVMTDGVLRVFAETRFLIVQNVLRLAVIAALIPWLMTRYGLIGAVSSTLVAMALSKVIALARVKRVMQASWRQLLPWRDMALIIAIAAAAALPALLAKNMLDVPVIPRLLIAGLLYTLAYYFLLRWYGPMDDEEKHMLRQWTEMPVSRLYRPRRIKTGSGTPP